MKTPDYETYGGRQRPPTIDPRLAIAVADSEAENLAVRREHADRADRRGRSPEGGIQRAAAASRPRSAMPAMPLVPQSGAGDQS